MPHGTKIATCCYCGSRTVLHLAGDVQHELACSSCGAPLHNLKMIKADRLPDRPVTAKKAKPVAVTNSPVWERKVKPKKVKKRKSLARKFLSEAFDVIEDIFD